MKNISVNIDNDSIINNINATTRSGKILAIMGPSGSGKTTLLKTIAGLLDHSGDILIDNKNISSVPTRKRNMGMVTQDLALFPHKTIKENIIFPLKIRKQEKNIDEIIERFGLKGLEDKLPQEVSGGEQQRTAIARAMVYKPQVLLMDEPFGQLDAVLRYDLLKWLKVVLKEKNMLVLFVTHNQREAKFIGDKILFLDHGKKLFEGDFSDLEKSDNVIVREFLKKDL